MEDAGNCGGEQDCRAAALKAGGNEDDDTFAFIIQVKEEVERCLEAGMSKEQMFRVLREKGSHPAAAFAVYKELRYQNKDFFKEYYAKMDLRKQAERLKLLVHRYRTVRDVGAGAGAPGTAMQQTDMAVPDDVGLPENRTVQVGMDGRRQSAVQTMHVPTGQLLRYREQPVPNSGFQGVLVPSGAGTTSNGAMAVSYPWACTDNLGTMGWHDEQAGPPQQWWPGACGYAVPPQGFYWKPPSSAERLPENGSHHESAAPRHSDQAEPPWQPGRQPQSPLDKLRAYRNFQVHAASRHGEQAHQPLHQWQTGRRPHTTTESLREVWDSYDHATSE